MASNARPALEPEAIEAGRKLFARECVFVAGAARFDAIPGPGLPEVAFAGRSNVGKSSLVNALTGRRTLARVSQTPGRTRQINFFDLAGRLMLVDLPGYGYARASKTEIAAWNRVVRGYLRGRPSLRRLMLLVDCRHGIKPVDEELMVMLDEAAVSYQAVLTKQDRIGASALRDVVGSVEATLRRHVAAHPVVLTTSARDRIGIEILRSELALLVETGHMN